MEYLQKFEVHQEYGGPEEGGWWFDCGNPQWKRGVPLLLPQKIRYAICRWFNRRERKRRSDENKYDYTSVLSYQSTFYDYDLTEDFKAKPYPEERPHYE